jgi:hypothetical protein
MAMGMQQSPALLFLLYSLQQVGYQLNYFKLEKTTSDKVHAHKNGIGI